ncbi:MAG: ddlA [Gammaproteobacteria bacterium]|jgi:D-alanine-D-alanine ligase|nr:ddlA [Gammaproteobacteria bacterium]
MTSKKHLLILCGGQSSEHEVSLRSAANVYKAINPEKYDVSIVGIDLSGRWHKLNPKALLEHQGMTRVESKPKDIQDLVLNVGDTQDLIRAPSQALAISKIDMVIPVLHGPNGEDGSMQGLLRLMGLPFVGSDVLGSAVSMDKDVMKRLLRDAGVCQAKFLTFRDYQKVDFDAVVEALGLPFFVKPCNLGSSIGVSKVSSREEFDSALREAFLHDRKIIIEEAIKGREMECAVLGNENPKASVVGEIILHHDFYSYEAKYLDEKGATLEIPAKISSELSDKIRALAIKAYQVLECADLSRVDFFVTEDEKVYLNEINTFPGFTSISMYPMLWEAAGLPYTTLIESLIDLACARHEKDKLLKR